MTLRSRHKMVTRPVAAAGIPKRSLADLWRITLALAFILFGHIERAEAQGSCGTPDGPEELGTITKLEQRSVQGSLCGFTEYTYDGDWTEGRQYHADDSVFYNGAFWRATSDTTDEPSCTSDSWKRADAIMYLKQETDIVMLYKDLEVGCYSNGSQSFHNKQSVFKNVTTYDPKTCETDGTCSGLGQDSSASEPYFDENTDNWTYTTDCMEDYTDYTGSENIIDISDNHADFSMYDSTNYVQTETRTPIQDVIQQDGADGYSCDCGTVGDLGPDATDTVTYS